jgi:hypothetical protein
MEAHLRNLDEKVSVLSTVDDPAVKGRIAETFGDDPRAALIYRGVQLRMTQQQIADALKERDLPGATQPRVSETLTDLEERGFVRRTKKAGFVVREGWEDFGLNRVLKRALKKHKVDDLVQ